MQSPPVISINSLPTGCQVVLPSSSFFTRNGPNAILPSAGEVSALGLSKDPKYLDYEGPAPIVYESLGLLVKVGREPRVTVAEGQCLWAIRKHSPQIPVPEIYGWTKEGDHVFLYMELIGGSTLKEKWNHLGRYDKDRICEELRVMMSDLRQLRQNPENQFLGQINYDPLTDVVFTNGVLPRAGPFSSVSDFHDWLSLMVRTPAQIHFPGVPVEDIPDPYREKLPDDAQVVFTHADLNPVNIMVSKGPPYSVMAIIDWAQSGRYPDYWEFCKAHFAVDPKGEWATECIPRFLNKVDDLCWDGFEDYALAYGY